MIKNFKSVQIVYGIKWTGDGSIIKPLFAKKEDAEKRALELNDSRDKIRKFMGFRYRVIEMEIKY